MRRFRTRAASAALGLTFLAPALTLTPRDARGDATEVADVESSGKVVDAAKEPTPDEAKLRAEMEDEAFERERWRRHTRARSLPTRAEVLSLTVAGGVSLGAYEAGQIYLLTEALRRVPGSARLMVATGASAGNANALIGATEACLPPNSNPEMSLGYRVWVGVGFSDLFRPEEVTSRSLFVQEALKEKIDLVAAAWTKGLPASCEFVFGLSVTRERGIDVELAEGLTVPRQPSRIVVHVRGRPGKAPIFRNYLDPSTSYRRTLLPFTDGADETGTKDIAALRGAILASAAFPVAFEPVPIPHCLTPERTDEEARKRSPEELLHCRVATRVDEFVDGGVFDNNPLGMTFRVTRQGLVHGAEGPTFRRIPEGGPERRPETIFGYVDPDLRNYPIAKEPLSENSGASDPLLGILATLGGEALSSSRGHELASLAETSGEVLDRLWLVKGSYPPVSELLSAFFGFLERDFRDFDFHLGTYDSYRTMRLETGAILGIEPYVEGLDREFLGGPNGVLPEHTKLGCLLSIFEPETFGDLAPLCARTPKNFRALTQLALLRLWSNCRKLSEHDANGSTNLACRKAHGKLPPPLADPTFAELRTSYQRPEESDFDYALRVLEGLRFHFRDLGLDEGEGGLARLEIRRSLARAVAKLADAQPTLSERTLVLTLGRTVVNGVAYEPPESRVYALVGTSLAVGYLGKLFDSRAWHANADLRLQNLRSLLTDRNNELSGAIGLGLEVAILPLSGALFQTSVGLRGGYQFAAVDSIGVEPCSATATAGESRRCSQPLVQVPVNWTLLERVRLNLSPTVYPFAESFGHNSFDLDFGVGVEFF